MRVSCVGYFQKTNYAQSGVLKNYQKLPQDVQKKEQVGDVVNFKGFGGKVVGGLLGAGLAGITAIAAMVTPVGWVTAATLIASEVGGAVVGGAVGDVVEGPDDDED